MECCLHRFFDRAKGLLALGALGVPLGLVDGLSRVPMRVLALGGRGLDTNKDLWGGPRLYRGPLDAFLSGRSDGLGDGALARLADAVLLLGFTHLRLQLHSGP